MDEQLSSPRADSTVIFGKYEMGRLLGQGTFAKVYHGRNIVTNDSVAIKVISKDLVKKAGMMDQIQREVSVMSIVHHPNIVELKEVMATKTKIYFIMEYVKGGELFARVVRGRLKESQARKYFQQLISAVDFCHSRGVSHRDLKPENLLVDENGNLKVSDFGLSALPEQRRQDGLLHTQCGTPAYVAPEVIRKKGYAGEKSDLWSCGVILFVLLAGYLPFQDENVMKMYGKIFKGDYQFPPWFPPDAKRLVMKLLVVDPMKRLSVDGIMRVPWFLKGFTRPASQEFLIAVTDDVIIIPPSSNQQSSTTETTITSTTTTETTAPFFNAFEFISSLSSGFDLSSLFTEKKRRSRSLFTSKLSTSKLMSKIESAAKKLNFSVSSSKEYYGVKMEGKCEGRKGPLTVAAQVYEVAPQLAVVEFIKCSGDTLEYVRFCDEQVRPALKDVVWSWQGDNIIDHDTATSTCN